MDATRVIETQQSNLTQTRSDARDLIMRLQDALFDLRGSGDFPEMDFPLRHFFQEGAYVREMTLPKGGLIVGKIHKHAHVNIVSKGRVTVFTDEGLREIVAPSTWVSSPYTKRVVYVNEETIWSTVHVTNKTDLAEIEKEIIAESFSDTNEIEVTVKGGIL